MRERAWRQLAWVRTETHRAAEIVDAEEIAEFVDHFRRRIGVALGGVGVGEAGHIPRVLDRRPLEAVADAEVGNPALTRDLGRLHHAARTAIAEPARHQNASRVVEERRTV